VRKTDRFGMTEEERIAIDGSYGEGGGQILRTALTLSCLTSRPVCVDRIRAGRRNPGLQQQHLTCLRAAREVTDASVDGEEFASQFIAFSPKSIRGGDFEFDVSQDRGSAGSVGLVLQALLPILAFAGSSSEICVHGGTHVSWSPPYHYTDDVLLRTLSGMGLRAECELVNWGFYPLGGGEVRLRVTPVDGLKGLRIAERGKLKGVRGISAAASLSPSVAQRQKLRAVRRLSAEGIEAEIEEKEVKARGKGSFLFLLAEYENCVCGFSSLGARGKSSEQVADQAVEQLMKHQKSHSALDPNLADQLIVYASIAEGETSYTTSRITKHLTTNLWVISQFLPINYLVEGEASGPGTIEIRGVGITRDRV
jgi:RNA 3'-terminal phosphate cyclase (ATP)